MFSIAATIHELKAAFPDGNAVTVDAKDLAVYSESVYAQYESMFPPPVLRLQSNASAGRYAT